MKAINPSKEEFKKLVEACKGGPVPFVIRLPNDQLTPVMVYANLRAANDCAFFLESAETGVRIGRYSFMGACPRKTYACKDGKFIVRDVNGEVLSEQDCQDPLQSLSEQMSPFVAQWPDDLDLPPLVGGVVGYLGYDCVHYFEPVGDWLPNEIGFPEMQWMQTDVVVCFDHLHSSILLSKCLLPEEVADSSLDQLYDDLVAEAEKFTATYLRPNDFSPPQVRQAIAPKPALADYESNHTEESFCELVERVKGNIQQGDIFQVVPSQRFSLPLRVSALDVYRALRKINPSAYMFALKFDGHEAIGSSPETQLRCHGGKLMMRPLAGSRPRTGDVEVDKKAATDLLADEKELAEHRMLVDLVRNDLGRVAKAESVHIVRLMEIEQYSHVMHITSEVLAKLAPEHSVYDALRSTFPAGTLSGAPKVRAMQLINDNEEVRRNLYGGLVGYIDYAGNSDSCIAIRMMMSHEDKAYVQAGCGVVADSVPKTEHQETITKASAVLQAIAVAQEE